MKGKPGFDDNAVSVSKDRMNSLRPLVLIVSILGLATFGCRLIIPDGIQPDQALTGQLVFCGRPSGSERFDIFLLDLTDDRLVNLTEKYVLNDEYAAQFEIEDSFGHSIGCDDNMRPYLVTGLVWSPGGDLILVNAGGPYLSLPHIMSLPENSDVLDIVEQWPGRWSMSQVFVHPGQYSWSPDKNFVAFVGMTASDGYSNLFIGDVSDWRNSNPDTSVMQMTYEYRDFPGVIYTPSWSPDGKDVAVSLNGHASGIAIISVDGTKSVYVTDDTSDLISRVDNPSPWDDYPAWKPSWFPDGRSVVFVGATTPDDRSTLFKVDMDGQNLEVLIPRGVRNPVVAPDGRHIAYIEYANGINIRTIGRIVLVDPDGRNRQVMATIKTEGMRSILTRYYVSDLSWSPDWDWLTFTSNHSGLFQLYAVSVNGRDFKKIIDFPGDAVYPVWRPDQRN